MEIADFEKSRDRFFETKIKMLSSARKEGIKISIKHFDEFAKQNFEGLDSDGVISDINKLPENQRDEKLFEILQDWINYLDSKGITSIKTYFSGFNRYLRYHKIKLTKDDIKDELTFPKKVEEEKYAITIEDIHKIFQVAKYRKQGLYLVLLSTGMRPHEALSLKKKHLKFLHIQKIYQITIPAHATKLKKQRTVFASNEATTFISQIIKNLDDEDLVWAKNEITKNAVSNEDEVFSSYCKKVGLTDKFETTGYHKVNLYCFRAYFFTKAAKVHGEEYAHKLIGHTGYLAQYDRKTLDEKLEMYEELEPELFIFDLTKKDEKIKKLTEANNELHKATNEIERLKELQKFDRKQIERLDVKIKTDLLKTMSPKQQIAKMKDLNEKIFKEAVEEMKGVILSKIEIKKLQKELDAIKKETEELDKVEKITDLYPNQNSL